MKTLMTIVLLASSTLTAMAETINVKFIGRVELETYECYEIDRSSLINRLCYEDAARIMIVMLRSTYYAYCDVPKEIVASFFSSKSMGRFYNQNIKSDAVGSVYACDQ